VVDTIDVGISPAGLALDSSAGRVYVANADPASVGSVSVIDTTTRKVVRTVPLGEGTWPVDVAVDPSHHRLFVTESKAGGVAVVDTRTWRVVDTVPVGGEPRGVSLDPVVGEVYVANGETVTVLDSPGAEVLDTIPVRHPETVVTDPAAGILVVDSSGQGRVSVVKTRTHEVVRTILVGGHSHTSGVQVDPETATAYVTAGRHGALQVIDLNELKLVGTVPAPMEGNWYGQPGVHPDTGAVYAPLAGVSLGVIGGR
jgi:YVTN family beta-propeller protein